MTLVKRVRGLGEALLLLAGFLVLPPLPRPAIVALARGLGRFACGVCPRLRRVARANLDIAFGESLSAARKSEIARRSFETFALTILDIVWFAFRTRRRLVRYVQPDRSAIEAEAAVPVVIVTAHCGNWEVVGMETVRRGLPLVSVAMPLQNPLVDFILNKVRAGLGQQVQARAGAVRELLRALRKGSSVALLLDQNTLPREGGAYVPFFGLAVPVSLAPAVLAARSGRPVAIAYCLGQADGSYRYFVKTVLAIARGDDRGATATIMRELQSIIHDHPEQWLWMYKRWKYIPGDSNGEAYPYYARRSSHEVDAHDQSRRAG